MRSLGRDGGLKRIVIAIVRGRGIFGRIFK